MTSDGDVALFFSLFDRLLKNYSSLENVANFD